VEMEGKFSFETACTQSMRASSFVRASVDAARSLNGRGVSSLDIVA